MTDSTDLEIALPEDDWRIRFIRSYTGSGDRSLGNLTKAAKAAGVSRKFISNRLLDDTIFQTLYQAAEAELKDAVRSELYRRATQGTERPIYQAGELVGTVTEYDNRLLQWLAERLMPDEFHLATRIELTDTAGTGALRFKMGENDIEDGEATEVPEA